MSSKAVLRVPVDNDPDIEASVIPAVAKRMAAEGVGTASQAAVIRWGLRDAANPRRRSTTNAGIQNDVARSMIDELQAERDAARKDALSAADNCVVFGERVGKMSLELEAAKQMLEWYKTQSTPAPVANVDGARLKVAREAAGLSQQALADLLGYRDRSAVSLAERGRAPLSASMQLWLDERDAMNGSFDDE